MTDAAATPHHDPHDPRPPRSAWRRALYVVIFRHVTRGGKAFDLALLVVILASVVVVMLETVRDVAEHHRALLYAAEWGFTVLFTIEYAVRLMAVRRKRTYALSFFGIVDLLSILPAYLSLLLPGTQGLATIRALRLLRVFRILKLTQFIGEANALRGALWQSRQKLVVFLMAVVIVVTIIGSLMYVVEGPRNDGFSSIPSSIYWAIVTMTTVGYGDIVPTTPLGKALSAVLIVFGYSLIVVPTGIITAEVGRGGGGTTAAGRRCPSCGARGHDADAGYCKACGGKL